MNIKNYIKAGSKESSMRLAFLIVAVLCFALVATTIYVMIIQAPNPQFNGYGIAAIITAIAGLFSGAAYMKKEQRRFERYNDPGDDQNPLS